KISSCGSTLLRTLRQQREQDPGDEEDDSREDEPEREQEPPVFNLYDLGEDSGEEGIGVRVLY
ncbi:hypothetical protein KI387_011405, partial [Taxus chinensis]